MGRIDIILDDDLERELRMEVVKRLGGKKGSLKDAIQEAVRLWIDQKKKGR